MADEDIGILVVFRIAVGSYERVLFGLEAKFIIKKELLEAIELEPIFALTSHHSCIKCVAINDLYLASGGADEYIRLYDTRRLKELGSVQQQQGSITSLCFYEKSHLFSGCEDGSIAIWRTKDWELLKLLTGHKGTVNSISIHPSGKIALSVSMDRTLRLWNLLNGETASYIKLPRVGQVVRWNHSGDKYAVMLYQRIMLYTTDGEGCQVVCVNNTRFNCFEFAQSTNGTTVIIGGCEDASIKIYNGETLELICQWKAHNARIKALDVGTFTVSEPEESKLVILVTASSDGCIKVWNLDGVLAMASLEKEPMMQYNVETRITSLAVGNALII